MEYIPFSAFNKYFFLLLAAGFCPKNLAFARKMMALPDSGGGAGAAAPQPLGSYAYASRHRKYTICMYMYMFFIFLSLKHKLAKYWYM